MKNNFISILFPLLLLFILFCNQGCGDKAPTNSEDTTNTVPRDTVQPDVTGLVVSNGTISNSEISDDQIVCTSKGETLWSKCVVIEGAHKGELDAKQLRMCLQLINNNQTDMLIDSVKMLVNLPDFASTCPNDGAKNVTIKSNSSVLYELDYCFLNDKAIRAGNPIVVNVYAHADRGRPTAINLTACLSGDDTCCL